jgi:hypothetical protein
MLKGMIILEDIALDFNIHTGLLTICDLPTGAQVDVVAQQPAFGAALALAVAGEEYGREACEVLYELAEPLMEQIERNARAVDLDPKPFRFIP